MTRQETIKLLKKYPNCTVQQLNGAVKSALEFMESMPQWYDAQGDIVPEYYRKVIVIGRDGKVFYGHRPDPKGYVVVEGEKCFTKTYDKNGWSWPNIALWLDVDVPHELVDKIVTEYYKEIF